jgi:hypothetical protein
MMKFPIEKSRANGNSLVCDATADETWMRFLLGGAI